MIHIALVEPEIPWNTGNAGRTCLAAGACLHLVGPLGFSLEEKQVRRAGVDYWEHVEPTIHSGFDAFEAVLPELGEPFFFSGEASRTLYEVEYPDEVVLVFGKESVGLDPAIRARYPERLVRIPQFDDRVRSINVSTCVGIALYEVIRQRTRSG